MRIKQMSLLSSFTDSILDEEQVSVSDIDLLELSTEAVSHSLDELDRGLALVTSLEVLYDDTFGTDVSMESSSQFLERLDNILEISGVDVPIETFVSFEADDGSEASEKEVKEVKEEAKKGTLSKITDKVKEVSKKVVNEKTKEKFLGALKAIKEWIKQKAVELGKWLGKRIESVKATASKLKAGLSKNEEALKGA